MTGLLLLTGLLAQTPATAVPVARPGTEVVASRAAAGQSSGSLTNDPGGASPSEPVHQVGIGASMGMSGRGSGAGFRYFFGQRFGFNTNVAWYRPAFSSGSQGGSLLVAPSMVYMLTKPGNGSAAVSVRPYVGGGLNFATGSSPIVTTTSSSLATRTSGLGAQEFAGVEFTFRDANGLALSAEVAHYQLAVSPISSALGQSTNFYLLVHYYMR